jgi:uncharacterized protein (TIGR02265 family)
MKVRPIIPESEALGQRRALLQGGETLRGIIFQSVDRAVIGALGAPAIAEIKVDAGLGDQSFDAMAKYPLADFLRFEDAAAKRMSAVVGGYDQAICRIGAAAVESFFDSIAGKTMALLAGKDPTRLLSAVPNGYGLLTSYGTRTWRQTGANSGVFAFNGEFLGPIHNYGTFETALRVVHGVDAKFVLEQQTVIDFSFRITW